MGETDSKGRTKGVAHAMETQVDTITIADDFCENDVETGEFIPTIALSPQEEVFCDVDDSEHSHHAAAAAAAAAANNNTKDEDKDQSGTPTSNKNAPSRGPLTKPTTKTRRRSRLRSMEPSAVALPVGSLLSRVGDDNLVAGNNHTLQRRAEFISATLLKPSAKVELGLTFQVDAESGNGFVISEIHPDGLIRASGAPFQVGDKVISVNNCSCDRMDHLKAATLLRTAPVEITLVVQNKGGDPHKVETMITKPNPHHQAGIGFSCPESQDQVNVSCLLVDGLFAQSLLTIGDEVICINGIPCRQLNSEAAADIVRSAPVYVTVVAKKFLGNGMVIATGDDDDTPTKTKWFGISIETTSEQYGRRERTCHAGCQVFLCCTFLTALVLLILYLQVK